MHARRINTQILRKHTHLHTHIHISKDIYVFMVFLWIWYTDTLRTSLHRQQDTLQLAAKCYFGSQLNWTRASHTMTSIASRPTRLKHVSCLPVYEDKMGNCNLQFGLWVIVYSIFNRRSMWTSSQMSHDRQICFYAKFLFDFMISAHGRISLRVLNNFSLFTCKSIENRPLHSNFFAEKSWIDTEHVSTSPLTLTTHDENPSEVIFFNLLDTCLPKLLLCIWWRELI